VRLRAEELKKRAAEAGVTPEQLADAVSRDGLTGPSALSAVRNWMAGRDHPRCRRADIENMATAVGCLPRDIGKFTSMVRGHRGSPKKAKLVADLIRGKNAVDADNMLRFSTKRAAVNFRKALQAAMADADLLGADESNLIVSEAKVDGGMHIKRFKAKDRGRAHQILKRTSHITLSVQERN
jgi:large subunit ribosomal protein L22